MNRRDFLRRSASVAAGAAVVGSLPVPEHAVPMVDVSVPSVRGRPIEDGGYEVVMSTPAPTQWLTIDVAGNRHFIPVLP